MRLRLPALPVSLLAAAALAAPAQAAFFPAEPIDGPGVDVRSVQDLDIARDGTGAVAYIRGDEGLDHAFVSRLVGGAFQAPERVDTGIGVPATQAAVAATDGGRVVVAFVNGGAVFVSLRPAQDQPFTAPQLLATGASDPSVDMSIHGVAYVSFTVGGDVRVARLDRKATTFNVLQETLDIDAGREAGVGAGRSRTAVSAEGTGVVVFGEQIDGQLHAIARRVFRERVSAAPQDMTLPNLEGRPGGPAELPEIDMEDDSSFAWAIFRQSFLGQYRAIARRLVGSQFEEPFVADALATGGPDSVASARVELSGRGEGILSVASPGGVSTAIIKDDKTNGARWMGGGTANSRPAGGVAENLDRVAAWIDGTEVRGAFFDDDAEKRTQPDPQATQTISNPGLGPVDPDGGFDVAVDRAGDAAAVFVQGTGADRRLVAATYDREPGWFVTTSSSKWRNPAKAPLAWQEPLELWGPVSYQVLVNNQVVATSTTGPRAAINGAVPEGIHSWRVQATDRRGQTALTATRLLRIDKTAPKLAVTTRRRGRVASVRIKANDVIPPSGRAAGVGVIRITWGDGVTTTNPRGRRAAHRYGRRGPVTLKVSATDRAGNQTVYRKRLRIK